MASAAKPNGRSSMDTPVEKQKASIPRAPRPNYHKLHALPLPVNVYPLPSFIPHNPLSILQIALTYIRQLVAPPSSHPEVLYQGYFSHETRSVHVTDEVAIRLLWERGFFGKGSLSRSEPSWLDREKRRQGIFVGETSEEITGKRRQERREFKKERARKEREAIEEKLAEEKRQREASELRNGNPEPFIELEASSSPAKIIDLDGNCESDKENIAPTGPHVQFSLDPDVERRENFQNKQEELAEKAQTRNKEHLQLTLEEAFFLSYGLGVLSITDPTTSTALSTYSLLTLSRQNSYFPPMPTQDLQPDDPFLLSYVVYHHFRSLGWVIRPGIKFAVDYLLYLRGPVFTHAQFAVFILPSYEHPYWKSERELGKTRKKEEKSWWWVHCVNRVQTQVRKSLLLAYVEVPPPEAIETKGMGGEGNAADVDIGRVLKQYKVRELTLKRWSPNRGKG